MKNQIQLSYSKSELKNLGWSTISSRVVEYATMVLENKSLKSVYNEIEKIYDEETPSVFRGVLVYLKYGIDSYYNSSNKL